MSFRIRPARSTDIPAVTRLATDVLAEFGPTFGDGSATDAQLLDLPQSYDAHGGAFWVAVDDGAAQVALIGTCGVYPVDEGTFELRKMYLPNDARGRGVGKALFVEARAFVKRAGGTRLVLDTTD